MLMPNSVEINSELTAQLYLCHMELLCLYVQSHLYSSLMKCCGRNSVISIENHTISNLAMYKFESDFWGVSLHASL